MDKIKCECVGTLNGGGYEKMHEQSRRVYGKEGLSPTLHCCGGGNLEPKILEEPITTSGNTVAGTIRASIHKQGERNIVENIKSGLGYERVIEPLAFDEQNGYLRKDGCVGTLTTDGSSPKHNNRVCEPIVVDDYNGRIRADQSTVGCLTTNCGNDAPRNGWKIIEPKLVGGFGEKKSNGGTQWYQQDRVYDSNGIAMAHPAQIPEGSYKYQVDGFRIRKLTPKECWRLMDFDDADFDKAKASGVSDSQLYKQAGNSIVVAVLEQIFKEML